MSLIVLDFTKDGVCVFVATRFIVTVVALIKHLLAVNGEEGGLLVAALSTGGA